MGILTDALKNKKTVVILGHVNPDGDCIGSCLGMYNYLIENFENLEVSVYLEPMGKKFGYLNGYDLVNHIQTYALSLTRNRNTIFALPWMPAM